MLDELRRAKRRSVGMKQTAKAVDRGEARLVFVARDADAQLVRRIVEACGARAIELVYVDTMAELGRACGIEVGAASAALLEA